MLVGGSLLHPSGSPHILVVEDDLALRPVMLATLRAAGYVVDLAANGEEALAVAAARPPHVIVLDSQMPVMDGQRFARAYRRTTAAPAAIVAASARADAVLFAALVGAAEILLKPFQPDQLLAAVRRAINPRNPAP